MATSHHGDDDLTLATEDWINEEFGCEEESDFSVFDGGNRTEIWEIGDVSVKIHRDLTMTRKSVRRIVKFLRVMQH